MAPVHAAVLAGHSSITSWCPANSISRDDAELSVSWPALRCTSAFWLAGTTSIGSDVAASTLTLNPFVTGLLPFSGLHPFFAGCLSLGAALLVATNCAVNSINTGCRGDRPRRPVRRLTAMEKLRIGLVGISGGR
jgi:hypothetical protein